MLATNLIVSSILISTFEISLVFSAGIPPYDKIILVQQWSRSKCCVVDPSKPTEPANCSNCTEKEAESKWILHGLWPQDSIRRVRLSYCENPVKFIKFNKYPEVLLTKLREYWPDYTKSSDQEGSLWWQQWHKHGTCTRDIPGLEKHEKYFEKAIELYELHRADLMLNQGLIFSNENYTRSRIVKAVQRALNKIPIVTCSIRDGVSYLQGIQVCFTKQFEVTDCNFTSNCLTPVYYP